MAGRRLDSNRNNNDTTVYVGNLDDRVDDRLLYELMLQAGPLVNVYIPKDRVNQQHQGYGFAEFASEKDAVYAASIMNQIKLFGKPLKVNKASADKQKLIDVGADLFVGNLDHMVDEEFLYNTFSTFGQLFEKPRIARDRTTNAPKGYAFIKYCDFESSDKAIESLNGQFLMNKEVTVDYALKSGENGKRERHGDTTERLLAQEAKKNNYQIQAPQITVISRDDNIINNNAVNNNGGYNLTNNPNQSAISGFAQNNYNNKARNNYNR